MAKETPEQIVIDSYAGSRQSNSTFKAWSDDTFIGYATGLLNIHNNNIAMSAADWEKLVRKLLKEGKI